MRERHAWSQDEIWTQLIESGVHLIDVALGDAAFIDKDIGSLLDCIPAIPRLDLEAQAVAIEWSYHRNVSTVFDVSDWRRCGPAVAERPHV